MGFQSTFNQLIGSPIIGKLLRNQREFVMPKVSNQVPGASVPDVSNVNLDNSVTTAPAYNSINNEDVYRYYSKIYAENRKTQFKKIKVRVGGKRK